MTSGVSVPRMIPRSRRRFNSLQFSNSPLDVGGSSSLDSGMTECIESVKGDAYLCFWEDGSQFEGHFTSDNQSHYRLVGKSKDVVNEVGNEDADEPKFPSNYEVIMVDHDDEESYKFERVSLIDGVKPLCSLISPNFTFNANVIYKGQKADMLIQRYLTPRLVGQNLTVFAGSLSADINGSRPNSWKHSPLWCL